MNTIKIPPYNWFINKSDNKPVCNTFTGSCDTDKKRGCSHNESFNYKVFAIDAGAETARFFAECYIVKEWNDGYKKEDIGNKEASCSDEGLIELNTWLNEEHEKFLNK